MNQDQFLGTGTGMDRRPIKGAQIEVARISPAKDETGGCLVLHAIEQAEPMHVLGGGIPLSLASLPDGRFVQLAVVSSDLLDQIPCPVGSCQRMLAYATSIGQM